MKTKCRALLVAVVLILVAVLTQPSLAFYTTIGKATNVVTSGNIQLTIHEKTDNGADFPKDGIIIIPGDVVTKQVSVENSGGHPFYLRVKLSAATADKSLTAAECIKILDLDTTNWTYREDGYYYFNRILTPGETTTKLFTKVEIVGSKVDTSHIGSVLNLTVSAFAVQSENNPAAYPWDASGWPA